MFIPKLKVYSKSREFDLYSYAEISEVVKWWLLLGRSTREIEREVLGLNPQYSKGYQSMGILHYLGLNEPFKGLFKDFQKSEAISCLENDTQDFSKVVDFLKHQSFDRTDAVGFLKRVIRQHNGLV